MRFRGVPELAHQRMALERLLHDAALDSLAAAVNLPDFVQSRRMRRIDVLLDHRCDVARGKGVKVEMIFDGDAVRHRGTCYVGDG